MFLLPRSRPSSSTHRPLEDEEENEDDPTHRTPTFRVTGTSHFSLGTWHSGEAGLLAHLVQTGFGGFYDGMAHWAITPEDVMVVLALALLSALGGPERVRQLIFSLPAAWFGGGLLALVFPALLPPMVLTLASFGLVGLLIALDRHLSGAVFVPLVLVTAAIHGAGNGGAMREAGLGWLGLAGACVAVFVVASVLPALLVRIEKPAGRIAMRVGGSWLAAAALLMIGWWWRAR